MMSISFSGPLLLFLGLVSGPAIDEKSRRARFREILAEGPDAYFSAYFASQQQD